MKENMALCSAEEQLKSFNCFLENHGKIVKKLLCDIKSDNAKMIKVNKRPVVEVNYSSDKEYVSLFKLLDSDRILSKTILTFTHLCQEVEVLAKAAARMEMEFLFIDENLLIVSNDNSMKNTSKANEEIILKMSKAMEFIFQIQFLLQRLFLVGTNILQQCGVFLSLAEDTGGFLFSDIFDYLSVLLYHIAILDEILASSNFSNFWTLYKRTVQMISGDEKLRESSCNSDLNGIKHALVELDYLFTGAIFKTFLDCLFTLKEKIGPKGHGFLIQQFNEYVRHKLVELDGLNNKNEPADFDETSNLIKINVFCIVFHNFCGQIDAKNLKTLLEINIKQQGIMLIGNIPWDAMSFFKKNAPTLTKTHERLFSINLKRCQQQFLQNRVPNFEKECRGYWLEVTQWSFNIYKAFKGPASDLKLEDIKEIANLLISGLRFLGQMSYLIKAIIHLHVALQIPMTRTILISVCKLLELLKLIQETFQKKMPDIAKVIHYIMQYLQYKILTLLNFSKKKIVSLKLHDRNIDTLAAIKIAEKCLSGPPTSLRIFLTKLALNSTNLTGRILSADQFEKFKTFMNRMQILNNFQKHLQNISVSSFIYWHQSILSSYLKQLVEKKFDLNLFESIVDTANECKENLDALNLKDLAITKNLSKTNHDVFRENIISSLCAQTENFLRIEIHYQLQIDKTHPFEHPMKDYRAFILKSPIEVNGNYIILKDQVENYLSSMFYNMTTISLHDWKTYEQMRLLANDRLALDTVPSYLPNQTIEQGIDILEIMRNIHIFVSKYVYNMNSQLFVEQNSQNKHLDSIGIHHVANSLRTHGTGVINTTVNFTYQFLRQKFYTFSQFLFDEQIRSRLMKELRSLSDKKQSDTFPLYPYERADSFNKDIRKLGLTDNGQTYLDLFRKVITHVGNAMGYIRLVRSGSIQASYSASLYLPKFDDFSSPNLWQESSKNKFTKEAAENLELNIKNLSKNFSESADYFKILFEAFQPFFQNPHNLHLKNFYLIIPPLTLNYVEYMLNAKEKINRRERQDGILFDDGFAVGLACILKLLNQIGDFNSLQWFTTVKARFEEERLKIKKMYEEVSEKNSTKPSKSSKNIKDNTENEKLLQTLSLTERRINAHQMEYNLLFYGLSAAKIFFQ